MLAPIFIIALLVFFILKASKRPANFPPGPRGVPLLGYVPFLPKGNPYKAMQKLAESYGPVVGFFLGPKQPIISICGAKAVKEALHNDGFIGRPNNSLIRSRTFGEKLGLIFADSDLWQEQRRFSLRHLRDLGFGKSKIENQMMEEIRCLIQDMQPPNESGCERIVDFKGLFTISVINILWLIVAGTRYSRDDPKFRQLLGNLSVLFRSGSPGSVLIPFPEFLLKHIPGFKKFVGLDTDLLFPLQSFIQETIDEHRRTRTFEDAARDFIDVYIEEMDKQMETNSDTTFSNKQLVAIVQDLFIAGSETTSNSIGFAILQLIHHPEIQAKLHTELDDVCGHSMPSLAHRSKLSYLNAFLMEVQRKASIVPNAVPHCAVRDTEFQGYIIPKGSIVSINLDSMLNGSDSWEDTDEFRPERHLNADCNLIKNELFAPFGAGKRMCAGESLAKMTFFLFVASLVKTFQFKAVENEPLPTLVPNAGLALSYQGFKAVVVSRS